MAVRKRVLNFINQNMAVGVESQKVAKGLDGDGGPGNGFFTGMTMLIAWIIRCKNPT